MGDTTPPSTPRVGAMLNRLQLKGAPMILVVDDDPGIREVLDVVLELEGYRVCDAENGADALAMLDHMVPELILLDMQMPVLDGRAFARELRRRGNPARIVIMTASPQGASWAEEIGAEGFLAKPFELDVLLSLLARLCDQGPTQLAA